MFSYRKVSLLGVLVLFNYGVSAQGACFTLVGQTAPDFKAQAVVDGQIKDISLADFEGKNKILLFYPADFSFICPTELFAMQEKLSELQEKNTVILAISVDQIYTHQKWLETPKQGGGIKGITYPILSDVTKKISHAYQALDPQKGIALRATILIDKNNIIQASAVYNTDIGRSDTEILRVLDALLFTQEHGQVCPANWEKGQIGMEASKKGLKSYLENKNSLKNNEKNTIEKG